MASDITIRLIDGPSKFDLMLALFDWKSHRPVTFKAEDGREIPFFVTGVQAEDGSGESWNIDGTSPLPGLSETREVKPGYFGNQLRIYFRTSARKGTLSKRTC